MIERKKKDSASQKPMEDKKGRSLTHRVKRGSEPQRGISKVPLEMRLGRPRGDVKRTTNGVIWSLIRSEGGKGGEKKNYKPECTSL